MGVAGALFDLPDGLDHARQILVRGMAHVYSEEICACFKKCKDGLGCVGSGSKGCDNLVVALTAHSLVSFFCIYWCLSLLALVIIGRLSLVL